MLAYLVLASKNGAPIGEDLLHRYASDPVDLPITPADRIVWKNRSGTVVFIGWQAFTNFAALGSHWAIDDRGLTAFTNHCWPQSTGWDHQSGRSWADQLRDFLHNRTDLLAARAELFGQFALISLPDTGSGVIAPDFLNAEPVYVASGSACVAISNRAGLCARAVTSGGAEPTRSLIGAGWLLCDGTMLDRESGYWDVEHIPFGSHVVVRPGWGAEIVESARSPLVTGAPAAYPEVLEQVDQHLRSTLRNIARLPVPDIEFQLSGGKDSRLLLALILDEGLRDRFRFITFGPPDRADPLVARLLAERYRLDWGLLDRSGRPPSEEDYDVRTHTSMVEGMVNAWDPAGKLSFQPGVTVSGLAGEYLRFGRLGLEGTQVASEAELMAYVRHRTQLDPLTVALPEVKSYFQCALDEWVRAHLDRGEELQRIGSFVLAEVLVRARFGPLRTFNAHTSLSPYVTAVNVQANHRLPPEERGRLRLQIDLMRRCDVALTKIPFADKTWDAVAIAHLPDAEDYRNVTPIFNANPNAQNWRLVNYAHYRPMLERYLLDPDNPIQELVRPQRLAKQLASAGSNAGSTRRIWGMLTAAIWMGHHELPARIEP